MLLDFDFPAIIIPIIKDAVQFLKSRMTQLWKKREISTIHLEQGIQNMFFPIQGKYLNYKKMPGRPPQPTPK